MLLEEFFVETLYEANICGDPFNDEYWSKTNPGYAVMANNRFAFQYEPVKNWAMDFMQWAATYTKDGGAMYGKKLRTDVGRMLAQVVRGKGMSAAQCATDRVSVACTWDRGDVSGFGVRWSFRRSFGVPGRTRRPLWHQPTRTTARPTEVRFLSM